MQYGIYIATPDGTGETLLDDAKQLGNYKLANMTVVLMRQKPKSNVFGGLLDKLK